MDADDAKQFLVLGDLEERLSDACQNLRYCPRRASFAKQSMPQQTAVAGFNLWIGAKVQWP